jgi:hypothetical protein
VIAEHTTRAQKVDSVIAEHTTKLSSNDPPKLAILHPAITLTDAETVNGDVNNDSATYEVPRNTPASHETTMPVTVTPPLVP